MKQDKIELLTLFRIFLCAMKLWKKNNLVKLNTYLCNSATAMKSFNYT